MLKSLLKKQICNICSQINLNNNNQCLCWSSLSPCTGSQTLDHHQQCWAARPRYQHSESIEQQRSETCSYQPGSPCGPHSWGFCIFAVPKTWHFQIKNADPIKWEVAEVEIELWHKNQCIRFDILSASSVQGNLNQMFLYKSWVFLRKLSYLCMRSSCY